MRHLISLVRAGLLALIPFLFATLHSVTFLPGGSLAFHTPAISELFGDPTNFCTTLAFCYETIARLVPTAKDFTLWQVLGRFLDSVLANRAAVYDVESPSAKYRFVAGNDLVLHGLAQ